jgi:hypothetical protein
MVPVAASSLIQSGGLPLLRLAIIVYVACRTQTAWAQQFPYTAYVNAPDVYLRSGPGENYYPVSKLDREQQVEVYRHDPGGWYAVRPPSDCFSWVSAEFIEPRHGNIGVVIGERVVARVGSAFSDTRDVIQVRLDRGEEVEILEAHEFNSGPAAQTWYKIAPPAGEFRWVSGRYLDRQIAMPAPRQALPEHNLLIARHHGPSSEPAKSPTAHRHRQNRRVEEIDDAGADEPPEDWQQDEHDWDDGDSDDADVRLAAHEEPPPRPKKRRSTHLAESGVDEGSEDGIEPRLERARPERRVPKANLKEEAEDLDLALSVMVAEETTDWDFTTLRGQAEKALGRAETALDRGRIRRVLRKIEKFAEIQDRYLSVMDLRSGTDRLNRGLEAADRPRSATRLTAAQPLRYDGVGRLTQLSSIDPRLPQFALMDSAGKVAAYVSPAPGVNLRRYLNQEVGINGTLGYLPERQAQHLTAKRIVPVEVSTVTRLRR